MTQLDDLLTRFREISEGRRPQSPLRETFRRYAVTNFRGGIGKSTLAFNLAWELSRNHDTLLLDACPQTNFTQSLLGDDSATNGTSSLYDALLPKVMPGMDDPAMDDLLTSVPPHCESFKRGKKVFTIRGSKDLFLFPSLLYTQLSNAAQLQTKSAATTKAILEAMVSLIDRANKVSPVQKVLIDTSPFFGGATHLAWVAAEALIVPVRVDQHSMDALRLTLSMLTDQTMDFLRLSKQAGITKVPKVHALAMTHCGWNRQTTFTPDRSTQAYLSKALEIVQDNIGLFSSDNPVECIHLLDDFHSAGRISGTKRIPLPELEVGQFHRIGGQRLEVNESLDRYVREIKSLASTL